MMEKENEALPLVETKHNLVEIFYFFDPFSDACHKVEPLIHKLSIEYKGAVKINKILTPSLKVLTKCQAQSTSNLDNLALAYKAAEFQGRNKANYFLRYLYNRIVPNRSLCQEEYIRQSAERAGLDIPTFYDDINSEQVKVMLRRDLSVFREMQIETNPTFVFFSGDIHEEGIKVEGEYPYHIYTYIINELLEFEMEKHPLPSIYEYIEAQELVSFEEISKIYEWRDGLLLNELKKLRLQRLIKEVNTESGTYYKLYHSNLYQRENA